MQFGERLPVAGREAGGIHAQFDGRETRLHLFQLS